ncbi:MAG: hypothetical protein KC474_00560 [Cyanobacteria bacterium HKST-UBA04]|nr:hypothetical protein [Cyanobacteria bacterium HKST-UBA04]
MLTRITPVNLVQARLSPAFGAKSWRAKKARADAEATAASCFPRVSARPQRDVMMALLTGDETAFMTTFEAMVCDLLKPNFVQEAQLEGYRPGWQQTYRALAKQVADRQPSAFRHVFFVDGQTHALSFQYHAATHALSLCVVNNDTRRNRQESVMERHWREKGYIADVSLPG